MHGAGRRRVRAHVASVWCAVYLFADEHNIVVLVWFLLSLLFKIVAAPIDFAQAAPKLLLRTTQNSPEDLFVQQPQQTRDTTALATTQPCL